MLKFGVLRQESDPAKNGDKGGKDGNNCGEKKRDRGHSKGDRKARGASGGGKEEEDWQQRSGRRRRRRRSGRRHCYDTTGHTAVRRSGADVASETEKKEV